MSGPYGPPQGGAPQGPPGAPGPYPGPPPGQQQPGQQPGQQQPGGPGQWGQAPQAYTPPKPPKAPKPPRQTPAMGLDKILALAVAVLGALNFIWGFLPAVSYPSGTPSSVPKSIFGIGPAYLVLLFLIAGLLSLGPWEPKGRGYTFPVAIISTVAAVGAVIAVISDNLFDAISSGSGDEVGKGIGLILLLIFGLLQAAAAIGAWLFDAGVLKQTPKGAAAGYAPQSGFGQQTAGQAGAGYAPQQQGFGPPPPGFGGPQGPSAPQQGAPGADPSFGGQQTGGYGQQGGFQPAPAPADQPVYSGGYPTQAPSEQPGPATGTSRHGDNDEEGDGGQHPDVTQQVRF